MRRQTSYEFNPMIARAAELLPATFRRLLEGLPIFGAVDPYYAGLITSDTRSDGRDYGSIWCVSYPMFQTHLPASYREPTLAMASYPKKGYPVGLHPMLIIHELGHILDHLLGFRHWATPITKYGHTTQLEAFADAFTLWVTPEYGSYYKTSGPVDEASCSLFERLAVEGI